MWSFIFYLGKAQLLSPAILEYLSTEEKLFSLGPISLLPPFLHSSVMKTLIKCERA